MHFISGLSDPSMQYAPVRNKPFWSSALAYLNRATPVLQSDARTIALNKANVNAPALIPALVGNGMTPTMNGWGIPISTGSVESGNYMFHAGNGVYPDYYSGAHTTSSQIPSFYPSLKLFGPDYDVIEFSVFQSIVVVGGTGLKNNFSRWEGNYGTQVIVNFGDGATTLAGDGTSCVLVTAPDYQSSDSTMSTTGIVKTSYPSTVLVPVSATTEARYQTTIDFGVPYANEVLQARVVGAPFWVATRYRKWDRSKPTTLTIDIISDLLSSGTYYTTDAPNGGPYMTAIPTVKTVSVDLGSYAGSLMGKGIDICAPRSFGCNRVAQGVYCYNTSDNTPYPWYIHVRDQCEYLKNPELNQLKLTNFSATWPGSYIPAPVSYQDMSNVWSYAYDRPPRLISGIVAGEEVRLAHTQANYAIGSDGTATGNPLAKVYFRNANASISVSQFLRFWGTGLGTWNGGTSSGITVPQRVGIIFDPGSITNYSGCYFEIIDATGASEAKVYIK